MHPSLVTATASSSNTVGLFLRRVHGVQNKAPPSYRMVGLHDPLRTYNNTLSLN